MENQIRGEINQILLNLPESKLGAVLAYLKEVEKASKDDIETAIFLNKIFEEDDDLLKKLAQ